MKKDRETNGWIDRGTSRQKDRKQWDIPRKSGGGKIVLRVVEAPFGFNGGCILKLIFLTRVLLGRK